MTDTTNSAPSSGVSESRPLLRSLKRGFLGRCPHCGEGRLFAGFIKPVDNCGACGEDLHHQRADDLPPYINIVITGHVVVGAFTLVEVYTDWPMWAHLVIWGPALVAMAMVLMQPIKGAVIGLQWANYMHGFGGEDDIPDIAEPEASGPA